MCTGEKIDIVKCCQRDVSVSEYLSTTPTPAHRPPSTTTEVQHHQHHTKNIFIRYWDDHIKMKDSSEDKTRKSPSPSAKHTHVTFVRSTGHGSNPPATCDANGNGKAVQSEWTFPPKAPTPHIYNCLSPDMMAASDKNSFKGFRKQFSGRFKRLVTRKVEHTPVIPPELKPQLKTIYVY
ncbi:uncharacterized protein [Drosophila bipectinata]|uniref:uncharacterized protein isoform X1 n=1 Tax=Drosophila bipectinata TaxID=42026 RepID=UPI0038B2A3BC